VSGQGFAVVKDGGPLFSGLIKRGEKVMKKFASAIIFLCTLSPGLTAALPALAGESSVGTVTEVKGRVTVTRSDDSQVFATKNLPLYPGDTIETDEEGAVSFAFHQGDRFKLNEDSQVSLDELSSSGEDTLPLLRLALGYLWSRLKAYTAGGPREIMHTPTAVVGIRGTEFDTVVAEDASSTVTVDEGSVEIESEEARLLVDKGQAGEVDADEKIHPPVRAVPKEQRDWRAFRRQRAEQLFKNLPLKAPRIRKRFEGKVDRYLRLTRRINAAADRVISHLEKFREAAREKDPRATRQQLREIRAREAQFRPLVKRFRKAFNRVRVMGRNTHRLERFVSKNRSRFTPADLARIDPNLAAISQKRRELKKTSALTIAKIRRTYRDLRDLRSTQEAKGARKNRGERRQ
jgi:hypothetical protein